jgi:hypothetical protein
MRKLLLALSLACLLPLVGSEAAFAQTNQPAYNQGSTQSVAINVASAGTTQLVAASTRNQWIYVSHWDVIASGTGTVQLEYGTGTTCGTGTTILTGAYSLTAQNGLSAGDGSGWILFVPSNNALCIVTTVAAAGSLAYAQW